KCKILKTWDSRLQFSPKGQFYSLGESVTLSCSEGYWPSPAVIQCVRNGSLPVWSETPTCQGKCETPPSHCGHGGYLCPECSEKDVRVRVSGMCIPVFVGGGWVVVVISVGGFGWAFLTGHAPLLPSSPTETAQTPPVRSPQCAVDVRSLHQQGLRLSGMCRTGPEADRQSSGGRGVCSTETPGPAPRSLCRCA
ncbi:unnamed protein product, partial [Caretta caretta]